MTIYVCMRARPIWHWKSDVCSWQEVILGVTGCLEPILLLIADSRVGILGGQQLNLEHMVVVVAFSSLARILEESSITHSPRALFFFFWGGEGEWRLARAH